MIRFHIVVFNFERITSFLNNFQKIKNFDPAQDCLIIYDCSVKHESELQKVIEFANEHGWSLGKEVKVIRRKNWGIDQGARVDYISQLRRSDSKPQYIWQFQEHYLDVDSAWSIWPDDLPQLGGQVKGDVIPDGFELDLNLCELVYKNDPSISVLYADRMKVGIFVSENGRESLYADGANFSVRTVDCLRAFTQDILDSYKAIYDGSYQWTLFMELDICRQLTRPRSAWYDLVTHKSFQDPPTLRQLESEQGLSLHQEAESFYAGIYQKYETRFSAIHAGSKSRRKIHAQLSLWYAGFLASRSMLRLKSLMGHLGLAIVATKMRRYITGALKHQ